MATERLKFKPLENYYSQENNSYQLLPFRFTKLDEDRYVLTNLVGEFIVLIKNDLHTFIKKPYLYHLKFIKI